MATHTFRAERFEIVNTDSPAPDFCECQIPLLRAGSVTCELCGKVDALSLRHAWQHALAPAEITFPVTVRWI